VTVKLPASSAPPARPEDPFAGVELAAEALVAVTGLFPEPLTRQDGIAARRLPKEWHAKLRDFVEAETFTRFKAPPRPDSEDTYLALTPKPDNALAAGLADPQMASEYIEVLGRARAYTRSIWPVVVRDTPTGPEWLEPSTTAMGAAWAVLDVAGKPERVLDQMLSGWLDPDEAAAFRTVFPRLFAMVHQVLNRHLQARRGKPITWARELVVRTLLGLGATGMVSVSQPTSGGPPAPAGAPKIQIDFKALRTRGQRLDSQQ
jgi:hypothetical protein